MEQVVYVAYAHYFDGHTTIIGVYYSPDDARRVCEERENECVDCDWADWESFIVQ